MSVLDFFGAGGSVAGFTDGRRNVYAVLHALVRRRRRQVRGLKLRWNLYPSPFYQFIYSPVDRELCFRMLLAVVDL